MAVSVAGLRAESGRLRALGWSYRGIALEWQRRYHLNARVAFRFAHGWTQEEAARRWNVRWSGEGPPKTGKSFSYWEVWPGRGGRAPSTRTLTRLAELYLCRPGDLLDGEDFGRRDAGSDDLSGQPGCAAVSMGVSGDCHDCGSRRGGGPGVEHEADAGGCVDRAEPGPDAPTPVIPAPRAGGCAAAEAVR
ncbi:helix-turn-helix transcriptional regulator [Frankia sp. Cas4]|uniref:helix-turn-helix domain-containing protein n=1 Tax=Frankia sp. Cas4 TaxID=3073927 RepID=UPI002AD5AC8E|nr:helix-turn-helix transcriptional regulator [Frankia sp. Cas4]